MKSTSAASALGAAMADEAFLRLMREFCEEVAPYGADHSLAQYAVLRLSSPGVPDTYPGTELWQQTLVDPDNRQAIDFDARRRMLGHIKEGRRIRSRSAASCWRVGTATVR